MAIPYFVFDTPQSAAARVAAEIACLIRSHDAMGKPTVLGLATGGTPRPIYQELIRLHREEGLSFRNVTSFNLDEYLGLPRDHPQSYWSFMWRNLFDHIDILPHHVHLPEGMVEDAEIAAHCAAYETSIQTAGGIDYQILGIGRTGHIGFNEPGTPIGARTMRVHLDELTRQDAAAAFGGIGKVPSSAITMGCGTILDARRIALMAWGIRKAGIVREAIQGPISDQVSASYLQTHANAALFLDTDAASLLGTGDRD